MTANPPTSPSTGESTIGTTTLSKMLCHFTLAPAPAQPRPQPARKVANARAHDAGWEEF